MHLRLFAVLPLGFACGAGAQMPPGQPLPTGQALTPLAAPGARFQPLVAHTGPDPAYVADGASAIALSPNGREMLVLTGGYNRVNGADGKVIAAQSAQYVFRYAVTARGSRWFQTLTVPGGIAWRPASRSVRTGTAHWSRTTMTIRSVCSISTDRR